jgi:hypothetical protein
MTDGILSVCGEGGACRQRRQDRENQPHGGVQPGELGVVRERQVHVHALQIRESMLPAVEDAIVGSVDDGAAVRPEASLGARIHPRVHAGGHEPRALGREQKVGASHLLLESIGKAVEDRDRARVLELDHVQDELVGPAEVAPACPCRAVFLQAAQHLVGDGKRRQRLPVHDHVLELDAVAGESVERRNPGHCRPAHRRAWMRRTKTSMTARYSASFRTPSSLPASTLGLSLTSMTWKRLPVSLMSTP